MLQDVLIEGCSATSGRYAYGGGISATNFAELLLSRLTISQCSVGLGPQECSGPVCYYMLRRR